MATAKYPGYYVDGRLIGEAVLEIKKAVELANTIPQIKEPPTHYDLVSTGDLKRELDSFFIEYADFSKWLNNVNAYIENQVKLLMKKNNEFAVDYLGYFAEKSAQFQYLIDSDLSTRIDKYEFSAFQNAKEEIDMIGIINELNYLSTKPNEDLTDEEKTRKTALELIVNIDRCQNNLDRIVDKGTPNAVLWQLQINEDKIALIRLNNQPLYDKLSALYSDLENATSESQRKQLQRQIDEIEMSLLESEIAIDELRLLPDISGEFDTKNLPSDHPYWKTYGFRNSNGKLEHIDVTAYNDEIRRQQAERQRALGKKGEDYFSQKSEQYNYYANCDYLTPEARDYYNNAATETSYYQAYYHTMTENAIDEVTKTGLNPTSEEYIDLTEVQLNRNLALSNAKPDHMHTSEDEYMQDMYMFGLENTEEYIAMVQNKPNNDYYTSGSGVSYYSYKPGADLKEYYSLSGWEKTCQNTQVFVSSFITGAADPFEDVIDGVVLLGGKLFGEEGAREFVSTDYTGEWYDDMTYGIHDKIKYGFAHTGGNILGTMGTYTVIGMATPKWASAVFGALAASGDSAERSFNAGANYNQTLGVGVINGIAGFGTGWLYGKHISSINSSSYAHLGTNVMKGAGITMLEPIIMSGSEYAIYGHSMVDRYGDKVYDGFGDYFVDSGGLQNTVTAGLFGAYSSGRASYKINKTSEENFKIQEIYRSKPFEQKTYEFATEWGEHTRYSGNLKNGLEQQYQLLKARGYNKPYSQFLEEYVTGNFDVNTRMHRAATKQFYKNGGVSVMTEEGLIGSLTDQWNVGNRGIGYSDIIDPNTNSVIKKGGAWIVPMDEQVAIRQIATNTDLEGITLERARKGVSTISSSTSSEVWEIQYSGEFLKENGIVLNEGPSKISGASAAAMPGSKTYDLTAEGNFYTEALTPRVVFDFDNNAVNDILMKIESGSTDMIDLSNYGYPGMKFVKIK